MASALLGEAVLHGMDSASASADAARLLACWPWRLTLTSRHGLGQDACQGNGGHHEYEDCHHDLYKRETVVSSSRRLASAAKARVKTLHC